MQIYVHCTYIKIRTAHLSVFNVNLLTYYLKKNSTVNFIL